MSDELLASLTMDAEYDNDAMAAAMLRDITEEGSMGQKAVQADGLPAPFSPARGDWVVIFTGAFFHCGQLLGVDHEQYYLDAGSVVIDETGVFSTFFGEGKCTYGETVPTPAVIRKGPTTQVVKWPFNRVCEVANQQ